MGKAARALAVGPQPLLATDYAAISSTGCPWNNAMLCTLNHRWELGHKHGPESISTKFNPSDERDG